ncbi:MAG: hypothetical protein JWP91_3712 [Fibrobacteres bacterium]|nr:hypothetical protein [Fibrobacterota bacterium]
MRNFLNPVCFAAVLSALPAAAEQEGGIHFKGAQAFYEFGSIMKGVELSTDTLTNQWVQRFGGTFDLEAKRGDHLSLYFGTGSIFWHAVPLVVGNSAAKVFYGDAVLTKAFAQFSFGEGENPALVGKLGFIPVKYGNSRNLGEYLFRTGTYPDYIVTGNGYTAVNTTTTAVLGTQWTQRFSGGFSHDLFVTSERQSYPLHDLSLTYLAKYKGGFLNAGLGVQFDRLIPVKPSITTPTEEKNTWFEYQGRKIANNPEYYQLLAAGATHDGRTEDAARWTAEKNVVDSLRKAWEADPAVRPALNKFSFKGIKPLAMVALDFKSLFGEGLFRNDEMTLYTEAALMGWENRPIYYEKRMDRVVAMVGFNFPTFGLLDNLNMEVERCTSPFVNGYRNAREGNIPLPDYNYDQITGYDPEDWHGDDLKWSVYLGRNIMDGFQVQAQAASDHLRGRRYTRVVSENSLLVDRPDWYYAIKLVVSL